MKKTILVSGIQPTGKLHIGNYLGAIKNCVDLQNSGKYECYFFIADLHALTESPDPKDLHKNILNLAADFLAAGLDPEKSRIFLQSLIPAHCDLAWIFNTITPMGELRRMKPFQDKATDIAKSKSGRVYVTETDQDAMEYWKSLIDPNVGLFDYPVLMAADIMLYDAQSVPVGNDQDPHLELARALAKKFNSRFGETFVEPKSLHTKTPRVMSLKNPRKKMSKSDPASCLFIDDSPEEIKAKIARATTDSDSKISYDPEKKPGLANLLEIYATITHMEPKLVAEEFAGDNYSHFKSKLADRISDHFAGFRERKKELTANSSKLKAILQSGSEKAAEIANKKIGEVKKKIGIAI